MSARFVLGVDGGNSKTLAAVADLQGSVLGVGRSGNSNYQGQGIDPALREIGTAVRGALDMSGIGYGEVGAAYYALAGADLPEDFAVLRPALEGAGHGARVQVANDTMAALLAGSTAANAVVVIEGAGTNAAGRNAAGDEVRLPGLGWSSGDWGGGADLAREAFRLACRADDGRGRATLLADLFVDAAGAADVSELIASLYTGRLHRGFLLSLVPLIFAAAETGDAVAEDLLRRLGGEVGVTALALLRRLKLQDAEADVVLAGSLFRAQYPLMVETARTVIAEGAPRARVVIPLADPVVGAVLGALTLVGAEVTEGVRARVLETYARAQGERVWRE